MAGEIVVVRKAPRDVPATGRLRCGVAEVDVTPHPGLSTAGYSVAASDGEGVWGRLFARAFYLEDAGGNAAAICVLDLMSGTRYVLERAAQATAPACGISPDRLLLLGTHTHTGPGAMYGNSLYDAFATARGGFDRAFADWLAGRVARAVVAAAESAVPARIAVTRTFVAGATRNRSFPAFLANADAARWNEPRWPGESLTDELAEDLHLDPDQRAVDPRLTVITALCDEDDSILGVLGTFSCHGTTLGTTADYYSSDLFGTAVRRTRRGLYDRDLGTPVVALAAAASGDLNGLVAEQGRSLARHVGGAVAEPLAAAAAEVAKNPELARAVPISVRYAEPRIRDRVVGGDPGTRLADDWQFGAPTLGGSEEGRTPFYGLPGVYEGNRGNFYPDGDPQHPKAPALGILQDAVEWLGGLAPCPALPIHHFRLGDHLLATVPGEPTAMAAFRMERGLRAATGAGAVTILGYAGDYGGYYTTPEEFDAQHYEGSSMLYGRNAARHVLGRHLELAAGGGTADLAKRVRFRPGGDLNRFSPAGSGTGGKPDAALSREGRRVEVSFRLPRSARIVFADGWWVRVERETEGGWRPLVHRGLDFDDVSFGMLVRRERAFLGLGLDRWETKILLPPTLPATPLRVRFAPRPGFPGLELPLPPSP